MTEHSKKIDVDELKKIVSDAVKKEASGPLLRDAVGVFSAFLIIVAFLFSGYMVFLVGGGDNKMPEAYGSGLFGLASAALGYLIGKDRRTDSDTQYGGYSENEGDSVRCESCGQPFDKY